MHACSIYFKCILSEPLYNYVSDHKIIIRSISMQSKVTCLLIPPYSHLSALQDIVQSARSELELEEQFFSLEEQWSEATLTFLPYKGHNTALLDKEQTLCLVEQLESAHTLLATMLMSRHISPLKDEVSQWAGRLGGMVNILQQVGRKFI